VASLEQALRDFKDRCALRHLQNEQNWPLHPTITIPLQRRGYLDQQGLITAKGEELLLQEHQ
jgi:hypothetical protein